MNDSNFEGESAIASENLKGWHKPAVTMLEFDRTALISNASPCDSGCCCCSYTPS